MIRAEERAEEKSGKKSNHDQPTPQN